MTAPTLDNVVAFRPSRRSQARTNRGPAPLIRTNLAPRPRMIPAATAWWTCPYWCTGGSQCYGGESFDFGGGPSAPTMRHHHGVILHEQVPDVDGGHADVRVEVSCVEDPIDGYFDGVQITVQADVTTGDLDALARIRDAVDAAIYHARQELPQITRPLPYAGGGRGSSPLEAS